MFHPALYRSRRLACLTCQLCNPQPRLSADQFEHVIQFGVYTATYAAIYTAIYTAVYTAVYTAIYTATSHLDLFDAEEPKLTLALILR